MKFKFDDCDALAIYRRVATKENDKRTDRADKMSRSREQSINQCDQSRRAADWIEQRFLAAQGKKIDDPLDK